MKTAVWVSDEKRFRTVTLLLYLVLFLLGETLGALYAKHLSAETVSQTAEYMKNAFSSPLDKKAVFFSQWAEQAKWAALLYVFGWTRYTLIASGLCAAFKGYLTGYAASFLFGTFGKGAMPLVLWLMLPVFLIWVPCYYHMAGISFRFSKLRTRPSPKKREHIFVYTLAMALLFLILTAECALEGFLLPYVWRAVAAL